MHIEINVTKSHVNLLKEFRIFTGWYSSFQEYKNDVNSTGWLKVGTHLTFRDKILIEPYSAIYKSPYIGGKGTMPSHGLCSIGSQSYSHSALPEKMIVGRYCSIGEGLKILDSNHPTEFISTSHFSWRPNSLIVQAVCQDKEIQNYSTAYFNINGTKKFPIIKNDVWIGQNVTLSMGITIGNGAVIAANSMVTKSVPDFAIVGGNPAKIIKYKFTEYQRDELNKIKWWDYIFTDFKLHDMDNIFDFIRQWKSAPSPDKYCPNKLSLPDDFL
jgi:acetyltransferase-like isoleucine patch superfamily enzyme